ncbi:hypothetical protein [Halomonas sp.]|uniref:hypothetical protein n=1 Tax=Halomonas sp. TaxID=1486246 RepID=UPI0035668D00
MRFTASGGGGTTGEPQGTYNFDIPNNPEEELPFGIEWDAGKGVAGVYSFDPQYYPERFPQTKNKELTRNGNQCGGEDISIKAVKNVEFHIAGRALATEIPALKRLQDHTGVVDVYSPISPTGGVEAYLTNVEIDATPNGFDPMFREWQFSYTIDLVSTGRDEYSGDRNTIVSAITGSTAEAETNSTSGGGGGELDAS